eukprot:92214-Pelagomonas_calceolata.AAC.1
MDLILHLSTRAFITVICVTHMYRRNPILPRCSFHGQSVSSQTESINILHDMLRQIQMQIPWQTDRLAHVLVKSNLLFVVRGSTPSTALHAPRNLCLKSSRTQTSRIAIAGVKKEPKTLSASQDVSSSYRSEQQQIDSGFLTPVIGVAYLCSLSIASEFTCPGVWPISLNSISCGVKPAFDHETLFLKQQGDQIG